MSSLIDRLLEQTPTAVGRADLVALRNAVARDLEFLLNTRCEAIRLLACGFVECRKSSLSYGIPDFSSLSLHSAQDRDSIRRGLEQAMALHESRLTRVRVTLEPLNEQRRVLRFKVEALLSRGSERQQVQFDAELQLHSQTYAVV
ncbi:MAG: type VI secretion system baseplate subunit TssE [Pseudomonas sp.]